MDRVWAIPSVDDDLLWDCPWELSYRYPRDSLPLIIQPPSLHPSQKLQVLHTASEEERKRLEAYYKEKISQYDDRLREVRRKEREFMMMQKLKQRSEELCGR